MAMTPEQISVNLYSLRERLKTPADFAASIRRLAEIGFKTVQLSGVANDLMSEAEFVRVCADHGITITATHEPAEKLLKDPQWSIDRLGKLGVTQTAYPYPQNVDFADEAAVAQWLARLEEVNGLLRAAGITLAYHNHHIEFVKVGGQTVMERIFNETTLAGEPDTYWVQLGGGSPLAWTKRFAAAGRLPMIHLKDVRIAPNRDTQFAELGAGVLDFAPIIAAAEQGGCQSFIIEQDTTYGRDEFEAVAESFAYLKKNFT
ncbi:MAG: sugar phosphate isomerase/epimerase [Opitutaceae bacterium]|nr:sugar phosphate isomerase/epimerase [Opitutaceae bacterium]